MVHHGLAGQREERLGHVQRQRPEPRPCTTPSHRRRSDYGERARGAETGDGRTGAADLLLTFGGAADHDDGDDALLGASCGHGWAFSPVLSCPVLVRECVRQRGAVAWLGLSGARARCEIYGDGIRRRGGWGSAWV